MDTKPYHHYLFWKVSPEFYQLGLAEQDACRTALAATIHEHPKLTIVCYKTDSFKSNTTFLLWAWASNPTSVQDFVRALRNTVLGAYIELTFTYFGMVRKSSYSGRTGKPEQVIQNFTDRLPYLIVYPFTKTHAWHQLSFDERRTIMGEHVKVGLSHPSIRQCLLYSYGVSDYEFVVSYETASLEEFQDLIIEMRSTRARPYTLTDIPMFTCIYAANPEEAL